MTGAPARRPSSPAPTLRAERALLRCGHRLVAGVDEVGRGALAGPVSVGVVVVDETVRTVPAGTRDSKLLRPAARVALVPRIRRWAVASGVGHASPAEIDEIGIIAGLRLAGRRALAQLSVVPDLVILDGNHDYITPAGGVGLAVRPVVKADRDCASAAAASSADINSTYMSPVKLLSCAGRLSVRVSTPSPNDDSTSADGVGEVMRACLLVRIFECRPQLVDRPVGQ